MGSAANYHDPSGKRHTVAVRDHVTWFEIPTYDLMRAKGFYDHLYGTDMETAHVGDYLMAFFPASGGVGGALVQGPGCIPDDHGILVYLNAGDDLDGMLRRVEEAGGRIIMGRSLISESAGSFALILDSEGNRLALHEQPSLPTSRKARIPKTKPARRSAPAKKTARKGREPKR